METPRHRREFLGLTLGASAALAASPLQADDKATKDEPKKDTDSPKPPTEADARMDLVLARFGKQLDEAARKSVRAEIDLITRRAETLRKFALDNGDGPYPVFQPYRAPLA